MNKINIKLTLFILFLVVLIDQSGFLIIVPVLPDLLIELTGKPVEDNAMWMAVLLSSFALMQLIFAPIVGRFSDKYGRKPIILLSTVALAIDYVIMALAKDIYILFIGRIIAGIAGATITVALACIADISTEKEKMKNFAAIYGAIGLAIVVGPIIGGLGIRFGGLRYPFWIAAVLNIVNLLFVIICFKETLINKKTKEISSYLPFSSFKKILSLKNLKGLLLFQFLIFFGFNGATILWPFFVKVKYGLSPEYISYTFIILGIMMLLVQIVLVPIASKKIGDKYSVILGLIFYTIAVMLLAFNYSNNIYFLILILIPQTLGGIGANAASSIISNHAPKDIQGELQGVNTAINSITLIISPIIIMRIFEYTVKTKYLLQERSAYLIIGIIFILSIIVCYHTLRNYKNLKGF